MVSISSASWPLIRYSNAHKFNLVLSCHLPTPGNFSTSVVENPSAKSPFIVQYLISQVGFSVEKANNASRYLSHVNSPSNPDKVIQFLRERGFEGHQIKNIVLQVPAVLCSNVEKTLNPKMKSLQEIGFSESELVRLIMKSPKILFLKGFLAKAAFCKSFFGSTDCLSLLLKDGFFLCASLENRIMPNIAYLRSCRLSEEQIVKHLRRHPRLATLSREYFKEIVEKADKFGFVRGSDVFCRALSSICMMGQRSLDARIKLLMNYGCSEAEISSIILREPGLFVYSVKNLKEKLDFLIRHGCELSYMIRKPWILKFSYEKRIWPRIILIQLLKSEGFMKSKATPYYAIRFTEKQFIDIFISPYKQKMPELHEVYLALCAGKVPLITGLSEIIGKK
ncbi:hypothetical protein HPP92_026500 [Vanilla planifolia]|uniref:Uncharacterized protein n=1 Tax=Vanilla planifolia TaxID=51239 RepID=A0A835PC37_VANPL|nr:hypothetical protein HPP92_026500 [Vanilla planifolia]